MQLRHRAGLGCVKALGFELRQAASGHDALDLLATGYRPHVIFMDLAMPGIDGWETIRRIREGHLSEAHIAVLSANAFEKGQDNDAGITDENFIVKPLRVDELLDWIGRALALEWVTASAPAPSGITPPPAPVTLVPPSHDHLVKLDELVDLGYVRGILNALGEAERNEPASAEFVAILRDHARRFQFDAMKEILRKARDATGHS